MIELTNVTVKFGRRQALDGFSLEVPEGASIALWGPNGAGKSTALHAILGLVPYTGRIRVDGHNGGPGGLAARKRIGWVPQQFSLDMTVSEAIQFLAALRQIPTPSVESVLDPVGLHGIADQSIASLSGGQKQRLSLALSLLGDPPVLLLDEPTASLDRAGREQIISWLLQLRRQGKTMLFASHRPDEIRRLADIVAILDTGRLETMVPAGNWRVRQWRRKFHDRAGPVPCRGGA